MQRSYGVVWREGALPPVSGKLELGPRALRLEGRARACELPYERVSNVHVGRSNGERIDGRPTVVVERRFGSPVTISTVAQPSLVGEIVERLAAVQVAAEEPRLMLLVVPIKPSSLEAVRELLAAGPPFDPAQLPGLDRHEVFLTQTEVVFLFESAAGADALAPVLANPDVWGAAAAWREHLAGPPRIADQVYSWKQSEVRGDVYYLPTPGPGDSDGGDIY